MAISSVWYFPNNNQINLEIWLAGVLLRTPAYWIIDRSIKGQKPKVLWAWSGCWSHYRLTVPAWTGGMANQECAYDTYLSIDPLDPFIKLSHYAPALGAA